MKIKSVVLSFVFAFAMVLCNVASAQNASSDTISSDRFHSIRLGLSYASVWPLQYYRLSRFTFPYGGIAELTFKPDADGPLTIGVRAGYHQSGESRGTVEKVRIGGKFDYTELYNPIEIVMHKQTVEFQLMARYHFCETRLRPFVDASVGVKFLSAPNEAFDLSDQGYFKTASNGSIGKLHAEEGYTATAGIGVGVTARLFDQFHLDVETRYEHGAPRQNFSGNRINEWILRFPEPPTNPPAAGSLEASDAYVTPAHYSTKTNVLTAQIGLSYELRFRTKNNQSEQVNTPVPKLP